VKQRPLTTQGRLAQAPVLGDGQQVLGGVDQLSRIPSILAKTLAEPPGRQHSGVEEPAQAVRRFVDGAVSAKATTTSYPRARPRAQLRWRGRRLGVDRVDLKTALQSEDDKPAQAVGDGRRVRVGRR